MKSKLYCPYCDNLIEDEKGKCLYCGARLSKKDIEIQQQIQEKPIRKRKKRFTKKTRKKLILSIIIPLIVLAIIIPSGIFVGRKILDIKRSKFIGRLEVSQVVITSADDSEHSIILFYFESVGKTLVKEIRVTYHYSGDVFNFSLLNKDTKLEDGQTLTLQKYVDYFSEFQQINFNIEVRLLNEYTTLYYSRYSM